MYVPPAIFNRDDKVRFDEIEAKKDELLKNIMVIARNENNNLLSDVLAQQDVAFKEINELEAEGQNLGQYTPIMTHSYSEGSPKIVFHAQLLADWSTIIKISKLFFNELNYQKGINGN